MRVQGYDLPQVHVPGVQTLLYPHQAAMFDNWENCNAFLLTTKTGSGKTRAVGLPVIKRRESALFVYPTNALITDQARALRQLLDDEGVSYHELTPENANEPLGNEEYVLVRISKHLLEGYCKAWGESRKGMVLQRLVANNKRRLVLVNPDILYLLLSLRFRESGATIGHLQGFLTVIFDEFHLYTGVELAHALWMIHLARRMNIFQRIVLLSATPDTDVMQHLEKLIAPQVIEAQTQVSYVSTQSRTVAHDVELLMLPTARESLVETTRDKLLALLPELRRLQKENGITNARGDYVPSVVILNSVVDAIALEDALVLAQAGIRREDIASIRGLAARSVREAKNKLLVIGTSAIEVGIDFQAGYLLFEAGDSASFMQRFGRIGRHCPGTAFLLCEYMTGQAFDSLPSQMMRDAFENIVNFLYPNRDARAWFATTFGGMVSVCAQAHNFRQAIRKGKSNNPDNKGRIDHWLTEALETYAEALRAEGKLRQTRHKLKSEWFTHYAAIDSFRTSLVSQTVWDLAEQERGRDEWHYDADVATLLRRAERLEFKGDKLYVSGYGAHHKVTFNKSFWDQPDIVGMPQTTARYSSEEMQFWQDDHLTPVSHVMHTPNHHIFVVAALDDVASALDWRITWFRCGSQGSYVIAFDGDALLLHEIYKRSTNFI